MATTKFFVALNNGSGLFAERETEEEIHSFIKASLLSDKNDLPKKKDVFVIKGQKLKFDYSFDCFLEEE